MWFLTYDVDNPGVRLFQLHFERLVSRNSGTTLMSTHDIIDAATTVWLLLSFR